MKKTLVAIAALASVSAFAQSSVTIDGTFDVSYATVKGDQATYNTTSFNSTAASSTSVVNLKITEDLGGGNSYFGKLGMDPRKATTGIDTVPFGLDEQFFGLTFKDFGTIKLGNVNSSSLDAYGAGSPLGTATGSGYGYTNAGVGMATRFAKSMRYESPVLFGGLTAAINYAPGNDNATVYLITAQRKATELGLKYVNGPLVVSYSNLNSAASTNVVTATVVPAGTLASQHSTLGINYTIGTTTLYLGSNKGDAIGAAASATGLFPLEGIVANTQTTGTRYGIKHVMGTYTLMASYAKQEVVGVTQGAATRKVTGMRAENALSKRTSLYAAYESFDTGIAGASATVTAQGGTLKTTAVGIRHTF